MFKFLEKFRKKKVVKTGPVVNEAVSMKLWATFYYSKVLKDTKNSYDIPLLDMEGKRLGPTLKQSDWCLAGIEGTACIDGVVYNYAGSTGKSQTTCSLKNTEKVRWKISPFPFGIGNKNNPLEPYVSIATDQSIIPFGSTVYIEAAVGSKYTVNGVEKVHNGYFRADDVGGAIKGNHIDVFIGNVEGGLSAAKAQNPFSFIMSNPNKVFEARIIKPIK